MAKLRLQFVDPPIEALQGNKGSTFYKDVAEALRENAGEWAILPRDYASLNSARSAAQNIKRGRVQAMPEGQYEAVVDEKHTRIHVRYVGEGGEHAHPHPDAPPKPVDLDHFTPSGGKVAGPDPKKVREWAAGEGIEVAKHGRLPADLVAQYVEALTEEQAG